MEISLGCRLTQDERRRIAERMADRLFEAMRGGVASRETSSLLRLPALREARTPETLTFSGGVSEYVYGREAEDLSRLGPLLARAVEARTAQWGVPVEAPVEGIRATVVGASQYTIQVSGSTIFVMPLDACRCATSRSCARRCPSPRRPCRPTPSPTRCFSLRRLDLHASEGSVALCYGWAGSATFARLDAFCRGVTAVAEILSGLPLVLVGDGDVGGLVGIHCHEEVKLPESGDLDRRRDPRHFDFIDIGAFPEGLRGRSGGDQVAGVSNVGGSRARRGHLAA